MIGHRPAPAFELGEHDLADEGDGRDHEKGLQIRQNDAAAPSTNRAASFRCFGVGEAPWLAQSWPTRTTNGRKAKALQAQPAPKAAPARAIRLRSAAEPATVEGSQQAEQAEKVAVRLQEDRPRGDHCGREHRQHAARHDHAQERAVPQQAAEEHDVERLYHDGHDPGGTEGARRTNGMRQAGQRAKAITGPTVAGPARSPGTVSHRPPCARSSRTIPRRRTPRGRGAHRPAAVGTTQVRARKGLSR